MKHLAKHMHDVTNRCTAVWCEPRDGWRDYTEDPSEADCEDCLRAASTFGRDASIRYMELRGKGRSVPR